MKRKKYKKLSVDECVARLKKLFEKSLDINEKLSKTFILKNDPRLASAIYDQVEPRNVARGTIRAYWLWDMVFENVSDYSKYFRKLDKAYWTDMRIVKIIDEYIVKNGSFAKFTIENSRVAQAIKKYGGYDKYFKILVDKYDYNFDELKMYSDGFWTYSKTLEIVKKVYDETGCFNKSHWIKLGYSEMPLNKFGLNKIFKDLGFDHKYISRDGEKYRSFYEVIISNMFCEAGIKTEKDVLVYEGTKYTCDFYIFKDELDTLDKDVIIEIFGLSRKKYKKRRKEKIDIINKMIKNGKNINFIGIEKETFEKNISADNLIKELVNIFKIHGIDFSGCDLSYRKIFTKSKTDYENKINALKENLEKYVEIYKVLPNLDELSDLCSASDFRMIKKLGGIKNIANLFDYKLKTNFNTLRSTKYTDDYCVKELIRLVENKKLKHYPNLEYVKKNNSPLGNGMRNNKRYNEVVKMSKNIKNLPNSYEYNLNLLNEKHKNEIEIGMNKLNNEYGCIPKKELIIKSLSSGFYRSLSMYYGGLINASKELGYKTYKEI